MSWVLLLTTATRRDGKDDAGLLPRSGIRDTRQCSLSPMVACQARGMVASPETCARLPFVSLSLCLSLCQPHHSTFVSIFSIPRAPRVRRGRRSGPSPLSPPCASFDGFSAFLFFFVFY